MRRIVVLLAAGVSLVLGSTSVWAGTSHHVVLKSEQKTSFTHNQGVARVPGGWILSGTDRFHPLLALDSIVRTDENLNILAINAPAVPPKWRARGYDHVGDLDVVGNTLYAALEQSDYTRGRQVTAWYDAKTLLYKGAVVLHQNENSFVTVDPATMIAYSMDNFDGNSLLRYNVKAGWKPLPPLKMSQTLHHTQGADTGRGAIWISTSDPKNNLYRVDIKTGEVDHLGTHAHPGGEGEGIDAASLPSGDLHALILDPTQRYVWLEHFDVVTTTSSSTAPSPQAGTETGPTQDGSLAASGSHWVLPGAALLVLGMAALLARVTGVLSESGGGRSRPASETATHRPDHARQRRRTRCV